MSTFIPEKYKKNIHYIVIRKHNSYDALNIDEEKLQTIRPTTLFVLKLYHIAKEEQVELVLYLLQKYEITHLNISFYSANTYNAMIEILNSYRKLKYVNIKLDTSRCYDVKFDLWNAKELYDVLELQTVLKALCISLDKVFPTKIMKKLSKLNTLFRIKFSYSYYGFLNRTASKKLPIIHNEIINYMATCPAIHLIIDSEYYSPYILKGLIQNTHVKYVNLVVDRKRINGSLEDLIDELVRKNKTIKWINFMSVYNGSDEKYINKYKDFKNDSGLKLFSCGKPIN